MGEVFVIEFATFRYQDHVGSCRLKELEEIWTPHSGLDMTVRIVRNSDDSQRDSRAAPVLFQWWAPQLEMGHHNNSLTEVVSIFLIQGDEYQDEIPLKKPWLSRGCVTVCGPGEEMTSIFRSAKGPWSNPKGSWMVAGWLVFFYSIVGEGTLAGCFLSHSSNYRAKPLRCLRTKTTLYIYIICIYI